MSVRRILAMAWTIAAFALMLWCWAFYAGPYRWAAEWQLARFGSYGEKVSLFGPLILLLIPAGLLNGWGPLLPPAPIRPEVRVANARRNARIVAMLGGVALLIGLAGGALGYERMQTPPTQSELVLATGTEAAPAVDLVTVTGIARTDLMVGYEQTIAGMNSRWSFVPLVAPGWRSGDPIRFLLKTNQTAWMPPSGSDGPWVPRMLLRGNPPFRMITAPSVLRRYALPGIVRTEYEKAQIPLDPAVMVVEQSAGEVFAPYWMSAAGGGLVGMCLLFAGLIGTVNARKAARA